MISDLHLSPHSGLQATISELIRTIDGWAGSGAIVLAGDTFELLPHGDAEDIKSALDANPELTRALRGFTGQPGRRLICLAGNHDGRLAWDKLAAEEVRCRLGAELALAADLVVQTDEGSKNVLIEHGHRFDPLNAFGDPRNPNETPLGHHVVEEILPALKESSQAWLDGAERLVNPAAFPNFVASRLIYRRMIRHLWWIGLPSAAAVLLKLPVLYALFARTGHAQGLGAWSHRLIVAGMVGLADLVLVGGAMLLSARRVWTAVGGILNRRGDRLNSAAKEEAESVIRMGYSGLITGHTHLYELVPIGDGFYANSGSGCDVLDCHAARFGLPPVFLTRRRISWIQLEGGTRLSVRLLEAHQPSGDGSRFERLVARTEPGADGKARQIAAFPEGPYCTSSRLENPEACSPSRTRLVRGAAAAAVGLAAALNLTSVFMPPLADRFRKLLDVVPLVVPQTAAVLVALSGLGLLFLARVLQKGQRYAWITALALLGSSALLHIAKGVDVEDALIALAITICLLMNHRFFSLKADRAAIRRAIGLTVGGALASTFLGALVVELLPRATGAASRLPLRQALAAVAERLLDIRTIAVPGRLDTVLGPVLALVGLGIVLAAGSLCVRSAAPIAGPEQQ